jgi:hypothetical protein
MARRSHSCSSASGSDAPTEGEKVVERCGARVFLDPVAAGMLDDKQLALDTQGDHYISRSSIARAEAPACAE